MGAPGSAGTMGSLLPLRNTSRCSVALLLVGGAVLFVADAHMSCLRNTRNLPVLQFQNVPLALIVSTAVYLGVSLRSVSRGIRVVLTLSLPGRASHGGEETGRHSLRNGSYQYLSKRRKICDNYADAHLVDAAGAEANSVIHHLLGFEELGGYRDLGDGDTGSSALCEHLSLNGQSGAVLTREP
jgi:hypothetical protein